MSVSQSVSKPTSGFLNRPSQSLLPETRRFRRRVKKEGGEIEDGALERLYDPILWQAKDDGWYSNLVFFGAGSAVVNVSGSIAEMFDASGNQNDAAQGTSSQRMTLSKDSVGGRWGAENDNTDDFLRTNVPDTAQPTTVFGVSKLRNSADLSAQQSFCDSETQRHVTQTSMNDYGIYAGTGLVGGSVDTSPHFRLNNFDGSNSEIFIDGTSVVSGDAGGDSLTEIVIGSDNDRSEYWDGTIQLIGAIGKRIGSSERDALRNICKKFYSI